MDVWGLRGGGGVQALKGGGGSGGGDGDGSGGKDGDRKDRD